MNRREMILGCAALAVGANQIEVDGRTFQLPKGWKVTEISFQERRIHGSSVEIYRCNISSGRAYRVRRLNSQ